MPLPEHDPKRRAADISKIRKLGYVPKVDLETGIKNMGYYIKNTEVKK